MSSLFSTAGMARASANHPWRVIAGWFLVVVLAAYAATGLGDALTTSAEFLTETESVRGNELIESRLLDGPNPITETVIIRSETAVIDDPEFQQVVQQTTADLNAMEGVVDSAYSFFDAIAMQMPEAGALVSDDRHTTIIPVTLAGTYEEASKQVTSYIAEVESHNGNGFEVLTVGDLSVGDEFNHIAESDLQRAELFALPIALVVLVVVFGALVAAGVPLILALVAIFVAIGLTALVGQVWDLSFFVVNMITMIGLAVGIDYALFIIERYREERRHGLAKIDAITTAGGTASKAVLFSGSTVVLALLGMFLVPTTIFRSLGLGAILAVVVAVAAMLTLVPAMLSLLGDRIDWPRRRRSAVTTSATTTERWGEEAINAGFWGRVTRAVMARPVFSLLLAVAILGTAATPIFDLERGAAGVETLPPSNARTAFEILNEEFSAGLLAPVHIVVNAPRTEQLEAGINELVTTLEADSNFVPATSVTWNQTDDLARISIPLATSANDPAAYEAVEQLRSEMVPNAFSNVSAEVLVTGSTAFNYDFVNLVDDWTPIVFAFVLGLSFILLMLAFRSIVVPVKAILMNLLSVSAAYGLMVLVFQKGVGHDLLGLQQTPMIEAWVPLFLFCVLFGLSMDYHVFLLSRIREHFDQTHNNRESVAVGLQSTARIITGAALIMVVVFGGFASGRLVMLQQVGFGLAVAVFLDATVVRSVLVPASMALLGSANWYLPKWLQWLPDLRVEGTAAPQPEPVLAPVGDLVVEGDD